jgi:hypothetical protein
MFLRVTKKQALKNRQYIKALWTRVKPQWVHLDTFFRGYTDDTRDMRPGQLAAVCDGKNGPHNTCGAVACFAGWNWTEHHYQNWCRKHGLEVGSTTNLDIWLGLKHDTHSYYDSRTNEEVTEYKEAKLRLKQLLKEPVYDNPQPAWDLGQGSQVGF